MDNEVYNIGSYRVILVPAGDINDGLNCKGCIFIHPGKEVHCREGVQYCCGAGNAGKVFKEEVDESNS